MPEHWGGANSRHHLSRPVFEAVDEARRSVADRLGMAITDVILITGTKARDPM